jgi:hypothetical protein
MRLKGSGQLKNHVIPLAFERPASRLAASFVNFRVPRYEKIIHFRNTSFFLGPNFLLRSSYLRYYLRNVLNIW